MKKTKYVKFNHEKEMPGSPVITDVFNRAWSRAYKKDSKPTEFIFNGYRVRIRKVE